MSYLLRQDSPIQPTLACFLTLCCISALQPVFGMHLHCLAQLSIYSKVSLNGRPRESVPLTVFLDPNPPDRADFLSNILNSHPRDCLFYGGNPP